MDLIEEYEIYSFFKIEQCAELNNFSLYKTIESFFGNRSQKIKLERITEYQHIMMLFVPKCQPFWRIIERIIHIKFKNRILVSYRLFTAYFLYLQYLVFLKEKDNIITIFANLKTVTNELDIIVKYSYQSKLKYGI